MKTLTKRISIALFTASMVLGAGSVAFAGEGHHHGHKFEKLQNMSEQERLEHMEDRLDKRVEKMTKKLSLTPAQATKVRQIMADAQTRTWTLVEANKDVEDRSAMRDQIREIRKESRTEIQAVLTPEQRAKAEELRAKHKGKRGKGHEGRGAKMLERLDAKLDLSDAQEAKVKQILLSKREKMKALKEQEPDQRRAAGKALKEQTLNEIEAVLTADQKVKFAELREDFAKHGKEKRGKGFRKHHGEKFD